MLGLFPHHLSYRGQHRTLGQGQYRRTNLLTSPLGSPHVHTNPQSPGSAELTICPSWDGGAHTTSPAKPPPTRLPRAGRPACKDGGTLVLPTAQCCARSTSTAAEGTLAGGL